MRALGMHALRAGVVLALLVFGFVQAQSEDPAATLDAVGASLERIERQLQGNASDAGLVDARRTLLELQRSADAVVQAQVPQLQSAQQRLAQLGPAPTGGGEAPDVTAQRQRLQIEVAELDAQLKRARLFVSRSEQLADTAAAQARERFRAQLFERTDSPLGTAFWGEIGRTLRRDATRLQHALRELGGALAASSAWRWVLLLCLVGAAVAARRVLGLLLRRFVTRRALAGRFWRSSHACALALLAMLVPGVVAYALWLAVGSGAPEWQPLLANGVGIVSFSAYVVGLGNALLLPKRPSWRLLPIPDAVAHGIRGFPMALGIAIFVGWALPKLATVAHTSLPTAVALEALVAVVLALVMVRAVSRAERLRLRSQGEQRALRPWWLTALIVAAWLLLVGSIVGILLGYVALGSFIVRQVVWMSVLASSAYLLTVVVDDAAIAWLAHPVASTPAPQQRRAGRVAQAVVLASGALRVSIWLLILVLLLAPFGEGPGELLSRTQRLQIGVTIGELQLRPAALLQSLLVLALALAALKALRGWLVERFLPTTSLDAGMRTSLVTLSSFIGSVIATALALSALGLTLDKVAWIASGLSVGIGFGLQAVVSNFVSGLILLAERPVKIGDWVALGNVEGDIQRINVRATEIRMADRSTVIVPNSELLTKVVRNVTRDDAPGLVQLKLPLPLDADSERARSILLGALARHPDVLEQPPPSVLIDTVEGGKLVFSATGFVASPRHVPATRSDLWFRVLSDMRSAGLAV